MIIKSLIRSTLNFLHLDITKNLEYDRLTNQVMKKVIASNSNCIDIGCHKGEILDLILKYSPNGKHFGFEPIPLLYNNLKEKYNNIAVIYPYALADNNGTSKFQFVKNAPAYSGINKRKYNIENPDIEEIEVELKRLDEVMPSDLQIDFVKIDVEGAELGVLKGAKQILINSKPFIIFECGLGASDYYGTKPAYIYNFLTVEIGLKISLLKTFLKNGGSLTLSEYENYYNTNKEYYFIAHK